MRLSLLISLSLLLLSWRTACAQPAPADDFFNSGAQLYISNNIPQAKRVVEDGLKNYPDDEKLKKLEALLKQQQQQQQSQQNQQNQSQQQKSGGQKQNESGQKKDGQQKQSEQQKSPAEKENGNKPENQNGGGQPAVAGQMSPEEAKRLLDAQKGDEQFLSLTPHGSKTNSSQPFKDW
jgi:Ca-activated chloride channel family protein